MRVLVAMSGGVDSSVAAALLVEAGHEVVGATLKLWGGAGDAGCCSVADVDDARRVADALGVPHHVFNLTEPFEERVVAPYVAAHAAGRTPNPCVECNRHIKFGLLLERAGRLGFDALATGHHARVTTEPGGSRLRRGRDAAKDQSYVLSMLGPAQLARLLLPVGERTKAEVRAYAAAAGLATAAKADSQDVCFVARRDGRAGFLGERLTLHPGRVVDADDGRELGTVPAVELVTVGQRRGLGTVGARRYAVAVDVGRRTVAVATGDRAVCRRVPLEDLGWAGPPLADGDALLAQTSAHGEARPGRLDGGAVSFDRPAPPVAPGQTVALYDPAQPDLVRGGAVAGR